MRYFKEKAPFRENRALEHGIEGECFYAFMRLPSNSITSLSAVWPKSS